MLTLKEYNYLTKRKLQISNLYMLPKLHKSKPINEIIQKQQRKYINIKENIIVEACPIVAIQHIGLKKCKMSYRYCDVSINNLSLKACPLF